MKYPEFLLPTPQQNTSSPLILLSTLIAFSLLGLYASFYIANLPCLLTNNSTLYTLLTSGIASLLVMALPAFLYAFVVKKHDYNKSITQILLINTPKPSEKVCKTHFYLLVILATIIAVTLVILIEGCQTWWVQLLPKSWQKVIATNTHLEYERIRQIMATKTGSIALLRFITLAIIPAFSEELYMRGALQPLLVKWIKKPHIAVLLVAFIFAFLHQSIVHFPSIFIYGCLFGYISYYSKSIYPSMLLHLLNNTATLIFYNITLTSL